MLEALRKQTASWVVKIFLGVLILSFAVWGIGDIFSGPSDATVAIVGDIEITRTEFSDAYRKELDRLNRQTGQQLDSEQARRLGIENFTLQRMISRALFDQAANDYGLTVSDAVLAAEIRTNPNFQNNFGRFDPLVYRDLLRQMGNSREYYEYVRRADLRRNQLINSVGLGAVASKPVVDAIHGYRGERRVIDVAVVPSTSVGEPQTPGDAILEQFHKENSLRYTSPEYRTLTFVSLTPEQLLDEVSVSENDIRDEYESRLNEFIEPERRDLSQIVLPDETKARDSLQRLKQGDPFDDVAREAAGLEPDDTSLGLLTIEDLPFDAAASAVIFAGAEGEYLEPYQSDFGWHVYRVNKVVPGTTKAFEEAAETLGKELALRRAADSLYELATKLEDELAGGANLEEAARRLNLESGNVAGVDVRGRDPDGTAPDNLPPFPVFLETAFNTPEGQESALTESSLAGYFIIRVDRITPPAVKPLDTIRDKVTADWKSSERTRLAAEKAAAMAERIRQGEDLASVAAAEGLRIHTTKPLTRFETRADTNVSGVLLAKVFTLKGNGDVALGDTAQGTGHAVAVLRRIDPAASDPSQPERQKLRESLKVSLSNDILAQYRTALTKDLGIEVNQRVLDSLF